MQTLDATPNTQEVDSFFVKIRCTELIDSFLSSTSGQSITDLNSVHNFLLDLRNILNAP